MRLKRALLSAALLATVGAGSTAAIATAQADVTPQIIGGHNVSSAPWGAQLPGCSGTIISPHWVLSAAHCVDVNKPGFTVRIGNVNRGQGTPATVKKIHTRFDIAVLELDRDIATTYVKLAATDPPVGSTADIYGWGGTCEKGCGQANILKTAKMRVDGIQNGGDGSRMVQLGQNGDGYAWFGDSGGPAMLNGVQFGTLCCGSTSGNGSGHESYSSVANSLPWITSITGVGGGNPGNPVNLALNKPAKGSAPCAPAESAAKAVNGSTSGGNSDKWCSAAGGTKQLEVDLGASHALKRIVVKHAGAGGESASFNTKSFTIETSAGGGQWTVAATVSNNTASTSEHAVNTNARLIRLSTTDAIARIYEIEAYA
jgi:hypothetical protein